MSQDIKYFISMGCADIKWLTIVKRTGDGTKTDPPQEGHLLDGEKILVTGVTGKIAFPIARTLAENNEVWGAARLRNPRDSANLVAAGITPLPLDMSTVDFSALPSDFTYVFHAAVDPGADDWQRCLKTNAHNSWRPALSLPFG